MGGIGMTLQIEAVGDGGDLVACHREVWESLSRSIGWRLKSKGNRVTTADYFWDVASDGFHDGLWSQSDRGLDFVFKDYAGCCNLSCEASFHWLRTELAARQSRGRTVEAHGYRVVGPELHLRTELIRGPNWPLVYVRSGMVATVRRKAGQTPGPEDEVAFGDSRIVALQELSPTDRMKVDWAALTGQCLCDVCVHHRKAVTPVKERATVKSSIAAVRDAWVHLTSPEASPLLDRAHHGLLPASWTAAAPPEGLAVLLDWLQEREVRLPVDVVAGMVCNLRR